MNAPAVAALGGGHGLAATLSALRIFTEEITAVVTVADDGGSSGRLRREFSVLPPGDLRMALAALCDDSDWGHEWRDVLQHRFDGDGPLAGHALGNLLILTLWQLHEDDPVAGLDLVARLLRAPGRVLPMASVPLDIVAEVRGLHPDRPDEVSVLTGQSRVAATRGEVTRVRLDPPGPPAHPESVRAIREADWVVLGPGSWFTSVMTHLLVPELREALAATSARRLLTLNLGRSTAETSGFGAVQYIESFGALAPDVRLDVVLADPSVVEDRDRLTHACAQRGADLVLTPLTGWSSPTVHDPLRYAAALRDAMLGPRRGIPDVAG